MKDNIESNPNNMNGTEESGMYRSVSSSANNYFVDNMSSDAHQRKLMQSHISACKRLKLMTEVVGTGLSSMAESLKKLKDVISVTAVKLKGGNNNNSREDKVAALKEDLNLVNLSISDLKLMIASLVECQSNCLYRASLLEELLYPRLDIVARISVYSAYLIHIYMPCPEIE